jgi:hypothetical protein
MDVRESDSGLINIREYAAWNGRMIDELENIWKEAVGDLIDIHPRQLPWRTEESHEKP